MTLKPDVTDLHVLVESGRLPSRRYLDAVFAVRDHRFWTRWAGHALLALGVGHLLAGVIFFFAYNWADLDHWSKFALIQGGLATAVAGALLFGLRSLAGRALLIAATVLCGVLLAVIGQTYQSGADVWVLFAAWMVLVLSWLVASRAVEHWMVWSVIAYIALMTWLAQVAVSLGQLAESQSIIALALLLCVFLLLRELLAANGVSWASALWPRYVLAVAASGHLVVNAIISVFATDGLGAFFTPDGQGLIVFIIVSLIGWGVYRNVLADYAVTTLICAGAAFVLIALGGRLIDEIFGLVEDIGVGQLVAWALMIAWTTMVLGSMTRFLAILRHRMREQPA